MPTGRRIPMEVKVGERTLFDKGSGSEGTGAGGERLIMREEDALGILK